MKNTTKFLVVGCMIAYTIWVISAALLVSHNIDFTPITIAWLNGIALASMLVTNGISLKILFWNKDL